MTGTAEDRRLASGEPWKRWGPYLSERQWGTVREDDSDNGDAWGSFTHDQARSRAYRWGEDGLAGFSDDKGRLCGALTLWNGRDPILKERLFGLTNTEGNHGEDVKEYYFYLDATPTHSYLRYLYKYPQRAFPYADLVQTNRSRSRTELEYELLDTGVFDDHRYFDVFVEYAKASPDEIAVRITVANRGPDEATVHVLPHLWFRNTWSWGDDTPRPSIEHAGDRVVAEHHRLGRWALVSSGSPTWLFTENETNTERIYGQPNLQPYVKDAFHRFVIDGDRDAVNPHGTGTKCAAHHVFTVPANGQQVIRLVLAPEGQQTLPLDRVDALMAERLREADEFYASITPPGVSADEANIMRQALAGMIWTKQHYFFDLDQWLSERNGHPLRGGNRVTRNRGWFHMVNNDVISMPDKWEYPWYAAWDLAFHTIALNMVDHDFAKQQLDLMLSEVYLHPNGQIPAYEWNFGDVNPPVHAWATLFSYSHERHGDGDGDLAFLKEAFQKLLLNFTWWVNRKDPTGRNVFEGGFLGLDNIGVFDRSSALPTGGHLEQADGTAWMAFFSQNMLEIALELARHDPAYEEMALKFVDHFFWIAAAMDRIGDTGDDLWDDEDGFFYDVLRLPDGSATRLKVRSMVGLLPLCATTVVSAETIDRFPDLARRVRRSVERQRDLLANIHDPLEPGVNGRRLLSVLSEDKLRRVLARMLDEKRFLSPHGIRSLSKWHEQHPYVFEVHGERHEVRYLPAESDSGMFGGNSNWRGPVWFPVNMLVIRALLQFYLYYGDAFRVECPTGSGRMMTLFEVAQEISRRLVSIFTRDELGRRPVYGGTRIFQEDPFWRDHLLFYEYFHGDNGAGLGASHQTGWTGLVARLIQLLGSLRAADVLAGPERPITVPYKRPG